MMEPIQVGYYFYATPLVLGLDAPNPTYLKFIVYAKAG